jgi:hypothetical protein
MAFRRSPKDEEDRKFDQFAHALTVIQEQHRVSHDGFMYHASGKVLALGNGATQDFLMAVPAGTFPHLQRFSLNTGRGDIDVLVYEATTTSADGSANGEMNVNRNSSNTPDNVLTLGPTVTGVGTLIHTNWIPPTGSGVGSAAGVLDVQLGEEWILKPSTKYLFRVTNESGGAIDLRYEFVWYELNYGT